MIYDMNDNIVAYCDSEEEVLSFTGIRKNNLRSRIKKGFCYYQTNDTYYKIYKFTEVDSTSFFVV